MFEGRTDVAALSDPLVDTSIVLTEADISVHAWVFETTESVSVGESQISYYLVLEEEEDMPAHNAYESVFPVPTGATATRIDSAGTGGAPPATRYRVRIVNTHTTDRLYIGRSQAAAQATTAEVVEADYGIWEDYLDANCAVWVRPIGSNQINVRMVQYATS